MDNREKVAKLAKDFVYSHCQRSPLAKPVAWKIECPSLSAVKRCWVVWDRDSAAAYRQKGEEDGIEYIITPLCLEEPEDV